ncbi:hypothetical protein PENANT_c023G02138 [Penicillium antarcticum]|uniref:Copper transport protein n=1 Tax=Penicillium antarcticum TaxID=416450 RepID=A0A1V6PYX2_9EURO|nr:hypothetical protein PENANT_c023G02138 [Penicillium antarcticum]
MNHHMNMEQGAHSEPDHTKHSDHDMAMAMPMTLKSSTQITLLFSWWSTTTVISYVLTLLVLFILVLFNRFLGILKLHLDQRLINTDHDSNEPPKLNLPPSRWDRNRSSKDRVSPLLPRMEENDDSERYGAFLYASLLQPTAQISSNRLEGRSMLAVMTYNIGVLCAVIAGIVVSL